MRFQLHEGERRVLRRIVVACLVGYAVILALVVLGPQPLGIDRAVSDFVYRVRTAAAIDVMQVVSLGGSGLAVVAALAWFAVGGFRGRGYGPLLFVAVSQALGSATTQVVKVAVARPRPAPPISTGDFFNYSFSSGHAGTAAAIWGATAWVAAQQASPTARRWILAAWIAVVAAVALSRIVLGAHWLTDVVAGWMLGAAAVGIVALLAERTSNDRS